MSDGLDFELDIDAKMGGVADAVTQLDRLEKQFKASRDELATLEKSFTGTDKSLEKLASQLADTRIAMQRAMQEGDDKKFWKLAQTTDDLTKKEEALRKKSGELKSAIVAQSAAVNAAQQRTAQAAEHQQRAQTEAERQQAAHDKRLSAASSLLDRYGGRLGSMAKNTVSAAEEVGKLTEGLSVTEIAAIGAAGAIALAAVAVVAVGVAFIGAAIAVGKYAVEQANAKRTTEQTLRALTQSNEMATATAASFDAIGHDTGATNDQLLTYSRGLTEARRQMGLAQASSKDLQTVLRAAATTAQALDDQAAGQSIIDQFNAGLLTADQLADRVDKKYGDVVKQKMLGLDQQVATLSRNLSGLTEHFDVKPILEGLSGLVKLTDKTTESGKFLQDVFDTVFGKTTGSLVQEFFVQVQLQILAIESVITDVEISFYKFKNTIEKATDIDLGPFGNLHDRINDVADIMGTGASKALDLSNGITAIGNGLDSVGKASTNASHAIDDIKAHLDPAQWSKLATDFIDGFVGGLDKGITRVQDKVKEIGGTAIKTMKSVLDINSPSRVFADIGMSIPEGLEKGVDAGAPSVAQSIDALVEPPQPSQSSGSAQSRGGSSAGSAPVFNITINGVSGAEGAIDAIEEAIVTFFDRRGLQMGTDKEVSGGDMSEVTLNGKAVLAATLILPAAGVWHADVEVGNGEALADAIGQPMKATLVFSDVTLTGTILPKGGAYDGRGWFRVVGGANGWGKIVDAKPYRSAAGVKASTVLGDVARDAGENLGPFPDSRVGGWYTRVHAEARDVIEDVAAGAWYVDESGTTQLGARPQKAWKTSHRLIDARPDRNWVRIAADSLKDLVPGAQVEGLTAATVRHELAGEKLHTTIWGTEGAKPGDRFLQRFAAMVRAIMRPTFFHALYEFRVRGGSGGYLDLTPAKKSLGLPPLNNVPVRVGTYGARGTPTDGTGVLVGFVNGDASMPFVHSFAGEWEGNSSIPPLAAIYATVVKLGDDTAVALAKANGISDLQSAISTGWTPVANDGGLALKTLLTTPVTGWATKNYATTKAQGT